MTFGKKRKRMMRCRMVLNGAHCRLCSYFAIRLEAIKGGAKMKGGANHGIHSLAKQRPFLFSQIR